MEQPPVGMVQPALPCIVARQEKLPTLVRVSRLQLLVFALLVLLVVIELFPALLNVGLPQGQQCIVAL